MDTEPGSRFSGTIHAIGYPNEGAVKTENFEVSKKFLLNPLNPGPSADHQSTGSTN
jgi:hypothetical protein